MHQVIRLCGGQLTLLVTALLLPLLGFAGPQFSRQYNTSCGTCHSVYPHLNDLGKAFRDAGFQFPENDVAFLETPALTCYRRTLLRMEKANRSY